MSDGTVLDTAAKFKRTSASSRRGPQNPARQRQPKRMGKGPMLDARAKRSLKSLKGPDKGMG